MKRGLALLPALVLLSGCLAMSSSLLADMEGGPPAARDLTKRAFRGDKQAQYELGLRYERGDGMPVDLKRARRFYRLAAADSGGTIYVYVPGVGSARGSVMPIDTPKVYGLPAARERLKALDAAK